MAQNSTKTQLPLHIVRLRNFMQKQPNIEKIEGGRTAYIAGFYEWQKEFNMSKTTFYRHIKQFEALDENFWYDKHCSMLLFYYAT